MRFLLILLAATTAFAQLSRQTQSSNTTESLRGVSAVSTQVAWASGTHGTYLRTTDAGHTWIPSQVPDATTLDFRGIVAFSADEAFLMSAGPGDQSRIYHTSDAGLHWKLQFTATNPKSFFDSIVFWDTTHGIVLGDPIPDETGKDSGQLKFELLITDDGQTWTHIPPSQLPPALEAEGAFAASNTSLAILSNPVILSADMLSAKRSACRSRKPALSLSKGTPCILPVPAASQGVLTTDAVITTAQVVPASWQNTAPPKPAEKESVPNPNIWFATGGRAARVFHSPDRGRTWQVFSTPIVHGPDSAGIFSIAFRDPLHGVIAGGDYKHPDQDGPNLAFTNDGGKTWSLSQIFPQSYYSAVAYDRTYPAPDDNQAHARLFLASPKSMYDFRPPRNPTRIRPPKKSGIQFNALSPYPTGGALFVGPHGSIATLP